MQKNSSKRYYRKKKYYSPEESKEPIIKKNQKGIYKNSKDFFHYITKEPKRPFQKCIEIPSEYQPININKNKIQSKKEKDENNENNKNDEIIENEYYENNTSGKNKNNNVNDIAKNLFIEENIFNSKTREKLVTKVIFDEDVNDSKSKELKLKENAFISLKNARKKWKRMK